jgi:predicted alpha-1,6-mannanase (GH76 family)
MADFSHYSDETAARIVRESRQQLQENRQRLDGHDEFEAWIRESLHPYLVRLAVFAGFDAPPDVPD